MYFHVPPSFTEALPLLVRGGAVLLGMASLARVDPVFGANIQPMHKTLLPEVAAVIRLTPFPAAARLCCGGVLAHKQLDDPLGDLVGCCISTQVWR